MSITIATAHRDDKKTKNILSETLDKKGLFYYYVDMFKHVDTYDKQIETILELLNALNDPTRQKIILIFQTQKEYCVNDIAKQFNLSRPTISHHLNLMKRSKILLARKDGKEVYYSFNKEYVIDNLEFLIKFLNGCCG
ncbi:MAG: metalloregulator ArsR/SmtB family transcription factor [Spirochaetes bacterium]|nr:metalloregulator ArsR/SmtB family transcription factor [Spirochaetota bacterium]